MDKFEIKLSSSVTAEISPIILKSGEKIEMEFCPKLVENYQDPEKNIRGKLVVKRFTKNNKNAPIEKFTRKDIHSNEYVEISLDTEETFNLSKGLEDLYENLKAIEIPRRSIRYIKKTKEIEIIRGLLGDEPRLVRILQNIDLSSLNTAISMQNLMNIKKEIEQHLNDSREKGYWQPLFKAHTWILSQLFSAPYVFFGEECYAGGKEFSNSHGKVTDYLYKNKLTQNIVVIEIKNPTAPILKGEYRDGVYQIHENLSDAINQILLQREMFFKNSNALRVAALEKGENFEINNIRTLLIYGKFSDLLQPGQKRNFEIFRNELKGVDIICFDELLAKIEILLKLIKGEI